MIVLCACSVWVCVVPQLTSRCLNKTKKNVTTTTTTSCQDSARSARTVAAAAPQGPRAMQQVSASALGSPVNGTQCGAVLTIYALTKTGSSFVSAHF